MSNCEKTNPVVLNSGEPYISVTLLLSLINNLVFQIKGSAGSEIHTSTSINEDSIVTIIKNAGPNGIHKTELLFKTRIIGKKHRDILVDALLTSGRVCAVVEQPPGRGRPKTTYIWHEYANKGGM